jgi:GNAT superfamily N-acetyltransferase
MSDSTFDLPGHVVFRLRPEHAALLQGLCERCSAYFELHDGAPPGPSLGEEEVVALPEGKTLDDKFLFGIRSATGELVGVLDLIRDFPAAGEWWLGLLMLDPKVRSAGLGARFYRAAEAWATERGAQRVLLGVLEQNPDAERFWRGLGFAELRRQPYTAPTGHVSTLIVMSRQLSHAGAP